MSQVHMKQKLLACKTVSSGQPFQINQLALINTHPTRTVEAAVNELVNDSVLERLKPSGYRLINRAESIARKAWRTVSNESLGITPTRLGAL